MSSRRWKWTKEACAEVAKQFSSRSEFWRNASSCYSQMHRGGWADELCAHMEPLTAKRVRWIYSIQSSVERVAYVGLTWNVQQRIKLHRTSKRPVASILSGPHEVVILSGPHAFMEAADAERRAVDGMVARGWKLVNAAPAGALGFRRRLWTKPACSAEALKYKTRGAFSTGNHTAYSAACEEGWLDEICGHMVEAKRPDGYWTKERCASAAAECCTRREFRKLHDIARQIAQRNGWMDEICAHMPIEKRPNGYWTEARCAEEARRYERRGAFAIGCPSAYDAAWKKGWLDGICGHMNEAAA